jgi:hypothetical protein
LGFREPDLVREQIRLISRLEFFTLGRGKGGGEAGEYQMAGIEELTALRESLAELRRKEAYVLCDNPSAGIDRLVQVQNVRCGGN